jgi:SMODS-associated NUDIX domain
MLSIVAEKLAEILGVALMHTCSDHIILNKHELAMVLTHNSVFRNRQIRVSMSEILSIKDGDRYILLDNVTRPERVTPVGGVVRFFDSASPILNDRIFFRPQYSGGPKQYDLRGFLLGKHFGSFLRWYGTGADREHSALSREIEEEFHEIKIPIISKYVRRLEFRQTRIVFEGPAEVRVEQGTYWQYRQFKVCELREKDSENSGTLANFIRSKARENKRLVLVAEQEIRNGRTVDGRLIGDSAGYLFGGKPIGIPPLFEKR